MTDELTIAKAQIKVLNDLVVELNTRILQIEFERRLNVELAPKPTEAPKA